MGVVAVMQGLHRLDPDDYHRDPAPAPSLSSTLARVLLNQSPLHAWTASPRLNPMWEPKDSATFDIGRAAHRAVLGAGGDFVAYPADVLASNGAASTKAAKEWEAEQREAGRTPLKAEQVDQIGAIADAVSVKLARAGIVIDPARSEMTAMAQIDGVWCRAMIDNAPADGRYLIDIKTTTDASPDACIRAVTGYGYDVQAAHYLAVWKAATGEARRMLFAFVEKAAPYEVGLVELYAKPGDEADWMDDANGKAREARRIWAECLEADYWPGYPPQIATVGAPGWHRARWENYSPAPITKPSASAIAAWRTAQAPERTTA